LSDASSGSTSSEEVTSRRCTHEDNEAGPSNKKAKN
jgi:hypothetical protein